MIDPVQTVERLIGARVVDWSPRSGGLTHASTAVATFDDGSTLFVKAATNELSAGEIRREIAFLELLEAPYLPEVRGMIDDRYPILLLEDLSGGNWPEPYPLDLSSLERTLQDLRETHIPEELNLPELEGPNVDICQEIVTHARLAAPGLVSWLEPHADAIVESATRPSDGRSLVHSDLWYSNLCFLKDRLVIVDWSHARVGSPWFDSSTVNIDLIIEGRRPLPMLEADKWASAHLAWSLWSLARGPGPGISDVDRWRLDNFELVDGAAWWVADELDLPVPPVLTDRSPGYR